MVLFGRKQIACGFAIVSGGVWLPRESERRLGLEKKISWGKFSEGETRDGLRLELLSFLTFIVQALPPALFSFCFLIDEGLSLVESLWCQDTTVVLEPMHRRRPQHKKSIVPYRSSTLASTSIQQGLLVPLSLKIIFMLLAAKLGSLASKE